MKWQPGKTAPKDREIIAILDQKFPPVVAIWNGACGVWSFASVNCNLVDGEWNDTYFETDQRAEIEYWMPMPEGK